MPGYTWNPNFLKTCVLISVLCSCWSTAKEYKNTNDIDDMIEGRTKFEKATFDPTRKTNLLYNISDGLPLHIMLSREKKSHCQTFHMKITDLSVIRGNGTQKIVVCMTEIKDENLNEKCHWSNNSDSIIVNQGNKFGMPYDCGPWYITIWVDKTHIRKDVDPKTNGTTQLSVQVSESYDPLVYRWFRTITNMAFIPGILLAFKRGFYAEGLVYLSTFIFSSTYHLCEAELHCFRDYDRLHDSDVYCSILSIIVTVWAMTGVKPAIRHVIYILSAVGLQYAINKERHVQREKLYICIVFGGIPACMTVYNYIFYTVKYRQCYPRRKRWLTLIPGLCLGLAGVFISQTRPDYYYYWHSLWHLTIMSSVAFLLPFSESEHEEEEWFRMLENEKSTYRPLV